MFRIRYTDNIGLVRELTLNPAPTTIDYPDQYAYTSLSTQDGNVIVQRPLRDARSRKWIWRNYGPSSEPYASQWQILEQLAYRYRLRAGMIPTVDIWEDVSGTGGFNKLDGQGQRIYTTVKFAQVTQTATGPGPVSYESTIEFTIQDPAYSAF